MIQRKIKQLCYWWCKLSSSFLQDSGWNCIRTIRFVYINGTKDLINMSHWTCKIINHALSERCNNLVIDISRSFSKYTMKEFINVSAIYYHIGISMLQFLADSPLYIYIRNVNILVLNLLVVRFLSKAGIFTQGGLQSKLFNLCKNCSIYVIFII